MIHFFNFNKLMREGQRFQEDKGIQAILRSNAALSGESAASRNDTGCYLFNNCKKC
jgi:hypothetical protein